MSGSLHAFFGQNEIHTSETGTAPYCGSSSPLVGAWDTTASFETLTNLVTRLRAGGIHVSRSPQRAIRPGDISLLMIWALGGAGAFAINGMTNWYLQNENIAAFRSGLVDVGRYVSGHGTIILAGCAVGQGSRGTDLLRALSRIWHGRRVIGFSTETYDPVETDRGDRVRCVGTNPLDTPFANYESVQRLRSVFATGWGGGMPTFWQSLQSMPQVSEASPHAKTALNGHIIRWPVSERHDSRQHRTRQPHRR